MSQRKPYLLFSSVLMLAIVLAGCGGGDSEPTQPSDILPPTVVITAPPSQSVVPAGQAVQVNVIATDDQAVMRIELYVDNSLVESRPAPTGSALTTRDESFTWSASIVGSHTLQARAYDGANQMGASPVAVVEVHTPGAVSPSPGDPTPPQVTVLPTATQAQAATPTPEQAMVTANVNANVRGGPGTNYFVVGVLNEGETAVVTGRNTDSSWWQISFQGGAAWIANIVVTANPQAFNVAVAAAPPPPPTNTPVPPTATAVPSSTPAPATGFRVDNTSLSAGQCTTLRWDFSNINAIYIIFGYGYSEEGQPGVGTRQVCPSVTTTYQARVVKQDNSQETHKVTVNVSGSGCGDPVIKRFVSTTYEVQVGEKFSLFWEVDCAKSVKLKIGTGGDEGVSGYGNKIDVTITGDTLFTLKVEKNSGGTAYAKFTVKVK